MAATRALADDGAGDSGGDARRRQRRTVAGQKALPYRPPRLPGPGPADIEPLDPEALAEILFGYPEEEIAIPGELDEMAFVPLADFEYIIGDEEADPGYEPEPEDAKYDELDAALDRIGDPGNLPPEENPPRKNPAYGQKATNLQRFIKEQAKELSNQQIQNLMRAYNNDPRYAEQIIQARKLGPALRRDLKQYKRYILSVASICETMVENVSEEIVNTQGVIALSEGKNTPVDQQRLLTNMQAISLELIEGIVQLDQAALLITGYAESIAHIVQQIPSMQHNADMKELFRVHEMTGAARQLLEGLDFGTTPLDIIGESFEINIQLDNFAHICEQLVIVCKIRNSILKAQGQPEQDKRLQGHLKRAFDTIINGANESSVDGGRYHFAPSTDIDSLSTMTSEFRYMTRQVIPKISATMGGKEIWSMSGSRPGL